MAMLLNNPSNKVVLLCLNSTVIFKPWSLPSKSTQSNGQEEAKHALNVALIVIK